MNEEGGVFKGHWRKYRFHVTDLKKVIPVKNSPKEFVFDLGTVKTAKIKGFWHTHNKYTYPSFQDIKSFIFLSRRLRRDLIFLIFIKNKYSVFYVKYNSVFPIIYFLPSWFIVIPTDIFQNE